MQDINQKPKEYFKALIEAMDHEIGRLFDTLQVAFTEIFKRQTDADDGKTMRNADFKLLRFDNGAEAFYNLTADPDETNNLLLGNLTADQHANYVYLCNEMAKLLGASSYNREINPIHIFIVEPRL